jgi:hypothetical protein
MGSDNKNIISVEDFMRIMNDIQDGYRDYNWNLGPHRTIKIKKSVYETLRDQASMVGRPVDALINDILEDYRGEANGG